MYISKLSLVNYRNFLNAQFIFDKGINTIIGENGSGKTNVFRAIRLLLDDNLIRSSFRLNEKDFHRGIGTWQGHWIIISLEFSEVSQDEAIQALFLHGSGNINNSTVGQATYNLIFRPKNAIRQSLSQLQLGDKAGLNSILEKITLDDYETIFTGKSAANFNDPNLYKRIVGDFDAVKFDQEIEFPEIGAKVPTILALSREISFTFIQALRDVVSDFQNNRTNPLYSLLKSKSGEIDPTNFKPITDLVKSLNTSIEVLQDVQSIRQDITATIKDTAGSLYSPSTLSIKSDLSDEADKLFQSLKLFVGEGGELYEGAIHELSLGGANLIYLTLKLLEFKYQKANQSFANFLLIEEPEAHIHTHIQKTLFDKLNYQETQIIYSTHSTHISEVCNVKNMNVLAKQGTFCEAFQPANGLDEPQTNNVQRYLDAIRSNLLFARSVILVEGDAEEILIPILIKKVFGVSLDELGISLINIRSTGFENVALLFNDLRIKKKCSIITDLDSPIIDITPNPSDSETLKKAKLKYEGAKESGLARQTRLNQFVAGNPWINVFYSPYTFEVDFVKAGNANTVIEVVADVYKDPATITLAKNEIGSGVIDSYGTRILTMANQVGKGWFAILLGKYITHKTKIPDHIFNALLFALPQLSNEVRFNILSHQLHFIDKSGIVTPSVTTDLKQKLNHFKAGILDFTAVKQEMKVTMDQADVSYILENIH